MSVQSKQPARRRRVVRAFAPAVGLLAAGLLVWQGSYAAFNATTQNTTNTWGSGTMTLTNNGGGATYSGSTSATFGGTNLKPGDSNGTGTCLTVKSTGSIAGAMHLYLSSLADSSPSLAGKLNLTITAGVPASDVQSNCTGFPTTGVSTVYSGTLAAMPATYAASAGTNVAVASGTVLEAYKLVWTFDSTADNTYQGKTATAAFTWELQ
ncbi:MAG TPA: hypothetical protein VN738_06650 [Acidothermaceae bacterium]|jgi:hypothetical protein|nr:hypothetical protein [Acidothermaceae bacterium]